MAIALSIINMCDCECYNRPELGGDKKPRLLIDKNNKKIAVDDCIADEVLTLWKHNIPTLGSCCGHNGNFDRSIIIEANADARIAKTLVHPDTQIMQWKLVSIPDKTPEV